MGGHSKGVDTLMMKDALLLYVYITCEKQGAESSGHMLIDHFGNLVSFQTMYRRIVYTVIT